MTLIGIKRKKTGNKKKTIQWSQYPSIGPQAIHVTSSASDQIKKMSELEGLVTRLMRVGIKGGGCSGLTYFFELCEQKREGDQVFGDDAKICVDPKSLRVLGGSILEYEREFLRGGFVVLNPKEKKSCSCGKSFGI